MGTWSQNPAMVGRSALCWLPGASAVRNPAQHIQKTLAVRDREDSVAGGTMGSKAPGKALLGPRED